MTGIELPPEGSTSQSKLSRFKKRQFSPLEWYCNLPIRSKQLTRLYTSEIISIVGLVGVGSLLLVTAGRSQLVNQAKSELAVTEIAYNIKINQMGFGFRGQSENTAIISAAVAHNKSQPLTAEQNAQIKQILQNEIKARNIEYATLVGKDQRIIVNANANRTGETFDPNNLVSEVFKNPQQIKSTGLASWDELTKESPPLPQDFAKQNALIRYTVTPVKDSVNGSVIGALVAGDIVNKKSSIVEETIKAFGSGYSGIYLRQPTGEFVLASSVEQHHNTQSIKAEINQPIDEIKLLEKAAAVPGEVVTMRASELGKESYTLAAKALPNFQGEPVAILVRGTQETALNELLKNSLMLQLLVAGLAFIAEVYLVNLLGRSISQPVKKLQQTTQKFAKGDRQIRAEIQFKDEIGQLAQTFNEMAQSIVASEESLAEVAFHQKAEVARYLAFAEITSHLYKSLKADDIFQTSVDEIRRALQADRVLIYRFNEDWVSGTITAESVVPGWTKAMGQIINDPLKEGDIDRYRDGRIWICNNIDEAGLTDCHCKILERLQVKANIVAPIMQENKLLGLLCAHQCSAPREWQEEEIGLFTQLVSQVGFALKQASLLEQLEQARQEAELARQKAEAVSRQVEQARLVAELTSIEQRQQKEELQHQLLTLLNDVEGSAKGDLTVRAEVSENEIGTVADFFNAIIESLREIVVQVKQASSQVNVSLQKDEIAVEQLSEQAIKQTEEITRLLNSVEQMTSSIQIVADNANKAATIARQASTAAASSGAAIDGTVENIWNLQKTVISTTEKVRLLGKSSQDIAKVVSLVQQIALQTNLLAINAGIEANRAGEEGESFRVIAEQVGVLAMKSTDATKEIEQVIQVIQLGTKEVVEAMEEGKNQVVDSTRRVINAKQNLEQIFEVSRQIDELLQSISSATVSQAQTSQVVTDLMQEIAKTSQHTSASSRKVCGSLRQTVEVAEQLQLKVGRFKIGTQG